MNDYTEIGTYHCANETNDTVLNTPFVTRAFVLNVYRRGACILQEATAVHYYYPSRRSRFYTGGKWTRWKDECLTMDFTISNVSNMEYDFVEGEEDWMSDISDGENIILSNFSLTRAGYQYFCNVELASGTVLSTDWTDILSVPTIYCIKTSSNYSMRCCRGGTAVYTATSSHNSKIFGRLNQNTYTIQVRSSEALTLNNTANLTIQWYYNAYQDDYVLTESRFPHE